MKPRQVGISISQYYVTETKARIKSQYIIELMDLDGTFFKIQKRYVAEFVYQLFVCERDTSLFKTELCGDKIK